MSKGFPSVKAYAEEGRTGSLPSVFPSPKKVELESGPEDRRGDLVAQEEACLCRGPGIHSRIYKKTEKFSRLYIRAPV